MSSHNKHWKSDWVATNNFKKCRKKNCFGTMIHCQTTYKPGGVVHNELECSNCSLIIKDPRYSFKYRNLYRQNNKFNRPQFSKSKK